MSMNASALRADTIAEPVAFLAAQIASRRFVVWLLVAAALPIPVFALLSGPLATHAVTPTVLHALFLSNLMHVGLSALFWIDRRYRAHMAGELRRYYWDVAVLAFVSLLALFLAGQPFLNVFLIVITSWNIHHFGRQNWGVLCLTALGLQSTRPSQMENVALHLGCVGCAIIVLPPQVIDMTFSGITSIGYSLILCSVAVFFTIAARQIIARQHPLRIGMTVAVGMVLTPMCFLSPAMGFIAIGAAHTAQYAIIMTVLGADRRQGSRLFRIGGMFCLATLYLIFTQVMQSAEIWNSWSQAAQVVMSSVVAWHFIIDAGLFRMGQPFQRQAMQESFSFLFARSATQK